MTAKNSGMADINVVGVVAIVVFYMLILGIGLWAAWRRKEGEEEAMLAGRSIGMVVGTFTLTGNFKMNYSFVFQPVIIANRIRGKRFLIVLIDTCYKSSLSTDFFCYESFSIAFGLSHERFLKP